MNKFKEFTNYLKLGALGGIMALLPCCNEDPIPQDKPSEIKYEFISHKNLAENLEFPSGLAQSNKIYLKSSKGIDEDFNGILATGPTFQNLWDNGGLQKYENPRVFQFSSNLTKSNLSSSADIVLTPLSEIDLERYSSDFDSFGYSNFPDSLWRARGLTLDGLVLKDNTILSSSNSSNKLFRTNELGQIDVFLEDDKLDKITKMIEGSDGKIYASEVQKIDENNNSLIISPKRVVSISPIDKSINVEFELPSSLDSSNIFEDYPGQLKTEAPFMERLKIAENSPAGKERNGIKFYISDLLKKTIYASDKSNNLSVIANNLRYPYLLGVDSIGNIFYATSPLSKGTFYPMEIHVLDPETKESKPVYKFNETLKDYINSRGIEVIGEDNKRGTILLIGFDVSGIMRESGDTLELLVTNSNKGTLDRIFLEKTPVEK